MMAGYFKLISSMGMGVPAHDLVLNHRTPPDRIASQRVHLHTVINKCI